MVGVHYCLLSVVFLVFPISYESAFTYSTLFLAFLIGSLNAMVTWSFIRRRFLRPLDRTKEFIRRLGTEGGQVDLSEATEVITELEEPVHRLAFSLDSERQSYHRMEKVRSEFLGNVSHELRTPLFTLQGYLETLLDGAMGDPEVNRTFLEKALAQTSRLNALVNDLIDISRIESGDMRLSPRYFDIREFLLETVNEYRDYAEQRKVRIETQALGAEPISVLADRKRLQQAVANLLENAIKYNSENGTVEVALIPQKGDVIVSIHDTGIGIGDEHQERIFERFYRVDKGRSREVGGTGLGLAIVKHIVHAHRGKIEVESQPGEGSTFRISLPR